MDIDPLYVDVAIRRWQRHTGDHAIEVASGRRFDDMQPARRNIMKDDDTPDGDDYEVGYGKTPLHTRFPKGVSGNPKGRPKGVRNFQTELREELGTKITDRKSVV